MKNIIVSTGGILYRIRLIGGLALALLLSPHAAVGGQAPVALGSAGDFAVLAGATVTSAGNTVVNGDLGAGPGTALPGFPPGIVNGAIFAGGTVPTQAQADLTTAYNDAAGRNVNPITVAGNIGGQTLVPGLYKSTSSLAISSGDLTLDAGDDTNAIWIFQMASTLTTTSGRQVILANGANPLNVFWQVGSSATLGTGSVFKGNILAQQSISLDTSATVDGRVLARVGAVTLDSNIITGGPLHPRFGPISLAGNGNVSLVVTNVPGLQFTVQTSTNLISWMTLVSTNSATSPAAITDPTATGAPQRFYRAFYQ